MFVVNAVGSTVGSTVGAVGSMTNLIPGVKQLKKLVAGSDQLQGDPTLEDMILYTAVDKFNLSIKSTPAKSLFATAALAVQSGPLMKKNEQGKWHQVQACLVPHWFLYYYDTDKEDEPKGVIDLQLYTNTHLDDNGKPETGKRKSSTQEKTQHVLTLTTESISVPDKSGNPVVNNNLRAFYFASDNKENLLAWTQAMNRDRYNVIRDERDAYQNLQDSFGGEMADLHASLAEQEAQRHVLATKAAMAQLALDDCRQAMQQVLLTLGTGSDTGTETAQARIGIGDVGESAGRSVTAFSERALSAIREMRDARQKEINSLNTSHQKNIDDYNARIQQLELEAQQLQQSHAHELESLVIRQSEKTESLHQDIRNAHAATEQTRSELAVAAAATRSATEKAVELTKVKNALVKECKTQRKRVEELEAEAVARTAEKDSLAAALQAVAQQKESLLQRIAAYDAEGGTFRGNNSTNDTNSTAATTATTAAATATSAPASTAAALFGMASVTGPPSISGPTSAPLAMPAGEQSKSASSPEGSYTSPISSVASSGDSKRNQRAVALSEEIRAIRRMSGHASAESVPAVLSRSSAKGEQTPDDDDNGDDDDDWKRGPADEHDTHQWAMTPAQLSELGWLSTEQQTALQSKSASEPRRASPPKDVSVLERAFAASLEVFSKGGGGVQDKDSQSTNSTSLYSNSASSSDAMSKPAAAAGRRTSMQMLTSFLTYDPNKLTNAKLTTPLVGQDELLDLSPERTDASASASNPTLGTSPERDGNVLRCLKCNGTVEGPMHSTCKCKQPQLEKKDPVSSSMLGGLGLGSAWNWNSARRASVNMTASLGLKGSDGK